MKTRLISIVLLLCMLVLSLSACGGDGNKNDSTTTAAQSQSETQTTAAQTTAAPETTKPNVPADETYVLEGNGNKKEYTPLNYKKTKGVWICQWDIESVYKTRNVSSFKVQIKRVLKNVQDLGFNTVIVQVRPYGDSYYPSEVYPESKFINGVYGMKKDFDPLKELIAIAHDKGISVHAWINPLRLMNPAEMESVETNYRIRQWFDDPEKNGDYIVDVTSTDDPRLYLNPAHEEVRQLIIDGAEEICRNYDIDALHMDDYFYPTTDKSFDAKAFAEYTKEDSTMTLNNWRRENINLLVRGLYEKVKEVDCRLLFGISPAGDINGNMNSLFADVKTWCSEAGYIDYICPQLYWSFNDSTAKFDKSYESWSKLVTNEDVKIMVGLALYKAGSSGEWKKDPHDIINQELEALIADGYCEGVMMFSYRDVVSNDSSKVAEVENFTETLKNWK